MSNAGSTGIAERYKQDDLITNILLGQLRADRDERDRQRRIEKTGDPNGVVRREYLYVSEVGTVRGESACYRKLFYEFHDAPKEQLSDETLMAFRVGDVIGLAMANLLAKSDSVARVELDLEFHPWPVRGRLDVLTLPSLRRVVEVKSTPVESLPYLPKEDHIDQLNLYVHRIRALDGYEGYDGTLFYVMKNSRKGQPVTREYAVPYDAERAQAALDDFGRVHETAIGDGVPDRPQGFTRSKYPCSYCHFARFCWTGPIEEKFQPLEIGRDEGGPP